MIKNTLFSKNARDHALGDFLQKKKEMTYNCKMNNHDSLHLSMKKKISGQLVII
jgi:hypothetical protein